MLIWRVQESSTTLLPYKEQAVNKERSALVFLSIIIGFVVIAFIIGDVFLEY